MNDVTDVERKEDKFPKGEARTGFPFYFQTKAPVDTATSRTCLPSILDAT